MVADLKFEHMDWFTKMYKKKYKLTLGRLGGGILPKQKTIKCK